MFIDSKYGSCPAAMNIDEKTSETRREEVWEVLIIINNLLGTRHFAMHFIASSSLVAQRLKHLPGMQKTGVQSLGQEDPLDKGMATQSSYSWLGNPTDREAWQATIHKVTKSWTVK